MRSVEKLESLLPAEVAVVVSYARGNELSRSVRNGEACGARHLVVDLGDAAMLDAATLVTLKRVAERLRSRGGELSLVCRHSGLWTLLRLTALDRSFRVVGSLDAAPRAS